jgi:hypothetical protein
MMKMLKKAVFRSALIASVLASGAAFSEGGVALEGLRGDQLGEIVRDQERTQNRVNTRLQEQLKGHGEAGHGGEQYRHQNQYRNTERTREQAGSTRIVGQGGFGTGSSGSGLSGSPSMAGGSGMGGSARGGGRR